MNAQLDKLIRNMGGNLAPTVKIIPDDFLKYSIPMSDLKKQYDPLLGIALCDWIKAIEPIVTLEYNENGLGHTLDAAIHELRKHQINATAIVGNPIRGADLFTEMPVVSRCDVESPYDVEFSVLGARWRSCEKINYSDGFYLFEDTTANLYVAGENYAYWGNRPVIAHVVRKEDK